MLPLLENMKLAIAIGTKRRMIVILWIIGLDMIFEEKDLWGNIEKEQKI